MPDLWLIIVATTAASAVLGRKFAERTGRNTTLWTLAGAFLNLGVLAAMLCAERRQPETSSK